MTNELYQQARERLAKVYYLKGYSLKDWDTSPHREAYLAIADQILNQTWDNGLPMFGVLDPEQELPPIYWNEAYPDITERVQRDMLNDNWRKVVGK